MTQITSEPGIGAKRRALTFQGSYKGAKALLSSIAGIATLTSLQPAPQSEMIFWSLLTQSRLWARINSGNWLAPGAAIFTMNIFTIGFTLFSIRTLTPALVFLILSVFFSSSIFFLSCFFCFSAFFFADFAFLAFFFFFFFLSDELEVDVEDPSLDSCAEAPSSSSSLGGASLHALRAPGKMKKTVHGGA